MGCLSIHIERVGGDSHLGVERIGGDSRLGCERVGGLQMRVFFVCDVGRQEYIRVTPEEPMWIVVGEDLTYRIRSNTDWFVN